MQPPAQCRGLLSYADQATSDTFVGSSAPGVNHRCDGGPTVVRLDAYRSMTQQAPELPPKPKESEPLGDANPLRALLQPTKETAPVNGRAYLLLRLQDRACESRSDTIRRTGHQGHGQVRGAFEVEAERHISPRIQPLSARVDE